MDKVTEVSTNHNLFEEKAETKQRLHTEPRRGVRWDVVLGSLSELHCLLLLASTADCPDSKSRHWFTTSFLQPLPYLVTP